MTNPENVTESAQRGDAITATASPRPWRVVAYDDSLQCDVYDANGTPVCTMVNFSDPQSDAALIVKAVNQYGRELIALHIAETHIRTVQMERDRLRDIVRRLADLSANLLANYEYRYREDQNSMDFVENARGFIEKAREAIGRNDNGPDNHRR